MTQSIPVLAEASPAPELRVAAPSLAVAMSTAMVLVDYALGGKVTPTPGPQAVAEQLPPDLVEASHPVRAVMVHGTMLRDVVFPELPADHAGHREWPALRRWLRERDDAYVKRLIESGVESLLAYQQPPGTTPTAAEIGSSPASFAAYAVEVLAGWTVSAAESRVDELFDPAGVRATLIELLDAIWELWLERAWAEELPALRAAVDNAPTPPPGCGGAQWVSLVTGLRPDPPYARAADGASRLVVMPCPGLARSLSLFHADGSWYVLFSPAGERESAATSGERAGISVGRLGQLAPVMHALGDRTRLAVVLQLLEHGPRSMQQLTDALRVHQSTISRQVAALRKANLVELDDERRIVVNREAISRACRTLTEALD